MKTLDGQTLILLGGTMTNQDNKDEFIASLNALITKTEALGSFRGKTKALSALRRIKTLSALR